MNYIYLTILTIIAVGFAARIFMYAKTGNQKYKHDIDAWWK